MEEAPVVVVGGGLSGLACARALRDAGRAVVVCEGGSSVGGRARSSVRDGISVDHGFQVMFRGYGRLGDLASRAGIPRSDLRELFWGAEFRSGASVRTLGGVPPKRGGLSVADTARLGRLLAEVGVGSPERHLAGREDGVTADAYLRSRGVSDPGMEAVLRPLFAGIFLDRELAADAGYLRYLMAVMLRGPALLPTDGLGQISQWLASALIRDGATIRLETPVAGFEISEGGRVEGVRLESGEVQRAGEVVLAVSAEAAGRLLEPLDPASASRIPTQSASLVSLAYRLARPLFDGRAVVLNSAPVAGDVHIDLMCQTSNLTRQGRSDVVLATSITTGLSARPDDAALCGAVRDLVGEWSPGFAWARDAELIEVTDHPHAQYRVLPGVRRSLPGPRTAIANLLLAGDLTTHPSLEGAVASGQTAARILTGRG